MDCLIIEGGRPLSGSVAASGAKNAALPIMAASLLAHGPVQLRRVPHLADVTTLARVLERLGVAIQRDSQGQLTLETPSQGSVAADARLVRKMRASFCVLGPLLARRGRAIVSMPGGCRIGERPVDLHLSGLAALGAKIRVSGGYVIAEAKRLRGATLSLAGPRGPTVTGTANVMCAATLARGKTTIVAAAREPEIVDLGRFLIALGARIEGLGTDLIEIEGVERLSGTQYEIMADRIEAGTLLLAAAITGGNVRVTQVCPTHLEAVVQTLTRMGLRVAAGSDWISVRATSPTQAVHLSARPYPGLPTDLQAQLTAVLALAEGRSTVRDCVFPDRFQHVRELERMGAMVARQAGVVSIDGVAAFFAASVTACDLRASAALVLAGLAADGRTIVRRIQHLDRGYEAIELKLAQLGASIERITSSQRVMLPRAARQAALVAG